MRPLQSFCPVMVSPYQASFVPHNFLKLTKLILKAAIKLFYNRNLISKFIHFLRSSFLEKVLDMTEASARGDQLFLHQHSSDSTFPLLHPTPALGGQGKPALPKNPVQFVISECRITDCSHSRKRPFYNQNYT